MYATMTNEIESKFMISDSYDSAIVFDYSSEFISVIPMTYVPLPYSNGIRYLKRCISHNWTVFNVLLDKEEAEALLNYLKAFLSAEENQFAKKNDDREYSRLIANRLFSNRIALEIEALVEPSEIEYLFNEVLDVELYYEDVVKLVDDLEKAIRDEEEE